MSRKQSPTRKVILEVPDYLLEEMTNYMEALKVSKKASSKPTVQYDPVKNVLAHRITDNGSYEFHLRFRDGSTEWVHDNLCQCEYLIREYLGDKISTAYLVCRVSSKAQSDRTTAISLEAQEKALLEALEKEGDGKYQRVKVIKIVGSAYKNIPTGLAAIVEAARAKDALYVWRVDRLSRNIVKFAATLDSLYEKGITIYSHQEQLFYNQEKRLDFLQHLLDSQKDSDATSIRVKAAFNYMRGRGDEAVGALPFGLKYEPVFTTAEDGSQKVVKKLVVSNPIEEALIATIVKESKTRSNKDIAASLNSRGKYKRGKRWTSSMISRIQKKKGISRFSTPKKTKKPVMNRQMRALFF